MTKFAIPKISSDIRRRGGYLVEYHETHLKSDLVCKAYDKQTVHGAALRNLIAFLADHPRLQHTEAQFRGLQPHGWRKIRMTYRFPYQDHVYAWYLKGDRPSPSVVTMFPYMCYRDDPIFNKHIGPPREEIEVECREFAAANGFVVEFAPDDVPDMYFPGKTVPVVWWRPERPWRTESRCGQAT